MSKADDKQLTDEVFVIYGITKAAVSIRVLTLIFIIPDITKPNPIVLLIHCFEENSDKRTIEWNAV